MAESRTPWSRPPRTSKRVRDSAASPTNNSGARGTSHKVRNLSGTAGELGKDVRHGSDTVTPGPDINLLNQQIIDPICRFPKHRV